MSIKQPRQKTKLIQVRCTEDEYERIHGSARAGGLTVAEYIRRISLHRRIAPVNIDYALVSEIISLGKQQNILAFQDGGIHSSKYADILEAIKNAINNGGFNFRLKNWLIPAARRAWPTSHGRTVNSAPVHRYQWDLVLLLAASRNFSR